MTHHSGGEMRAVEEGADVIDEGLPVCRGFSTTTLCRSALSLRRFSKVHFRN
jgi:hypothetical protein